MKVKVIQAEGEYSVYPRQGTGIQDIQVYVYQKLSKIESIQEQGNRDLPSQQVKRRRKAAQAWMVVELACL